MPVSQPRRAAGSQSLNANRGRFAYGCKHGARYLDSLRQHFEDGGLRVMVEVGRYTTGDEAVEVDLGGVG